MAGKHTAQKQSKTPSKTVRKEPDTQTDKAPASKMMRPAQPQNQSTSVTTENPSSSRSADDGPCKPTLPAPKSLFPCEKGGMLITESDRVQYRGISQIHTHSITLPEDQLRIEKNKHDNRHPCPVIHTQLPQHNNVKRSQGGCRESSCKSNQLVSPKAQDKQCLFPTVSSLAGLSMTGDSSSVCVESAAQVQAMDHQQKDKLPAQSKAHSITDQNQSKTPDKIVRKEPDSQTEKSPASKKWRKDDNCAWLQNPSCSCLAFGVPLKLASPALKSLGPFVKDGTKITESIQFQDRGISQIITDCINQGRIEENKHDNTGDCLEKTLLQAIQLARVQNTRASNEVRELRIRVENFEAEKAELEKKLKAEFTAQLELKDEINRRTFQEALAKEMAEYRDHLRAEGFNVPSPAPTLVPQVVDKAEQGNLNPQNSEPDNFNFERSEQEKMGVQQGFGHGNQVSGTEILMSGSTGDEQLPTATGDVDDPITTGDAAQTTTS